MVRTPVRRPVAAAEAQNQATVLGDPWAQLVSRCSARAPCSTRRLMLPSSDVVLKQLP